MQRIIENLNVDWLFIPSDFKAAAKKVCPEAKFATVSIPHSNVELPYHGFSEQEHCFVSWYRKHFTVPKTVKGRRLFLDFAGVMIAATVYINGKKAGPEHKGGYTPFSFDITELVTLGQSNVISVSVDSSERADIPPFGNVVDYLTFGGIYRDVELRIVDDIYVENIFAQPGDCWSELKRLDITATLTNTAKTSKTVQATATLRNAKGEKNCRRYRTG